MRLLLNFKMDNEYMPMDYHKAFLKFIKTALCNHMNGEFFDDFYNKDISKNHKKDISWSIKFINPKFNKKNIDIMGREVHMYFVTPDKENLMIFMNAFLEYRNIKFDISESNSMYLTNVKTIQEKCVKENTIQVKLLSPLVLRNHDKKYNTDKYISVADVNFIDEFKSNLKSQFPFMEKEINELRVDISGLKKTVVLLYGHYIDVSTGSILLMGENYLLDTMVKSSVGSRKSLGFGVMHVIDRWEMSI